jgi:hypothetical protein
MYVNGMGLRAIGRVKGVSHVAIMNWVREVGELLPNAYEPENIPQVGELDEDVSIDTPDADSLQRTIETPQNPIDEQTTVAEACSANSTATNNLTVTGKGGTLPTPESPLNAEVLNIGGQISADRPPSIPLKKGEENPVSNYEIQPIMTDDGPIYPAMGVLKTPDGQIILTDYPTDNVATRTPTKKPNCKS